MSPETPQDLSQQAAGSSVPRLSVSGIRIVDPDGNPVRLRGLNWSGLEYAKRPVPDADLQALKDWGANVVRLPFNQKWALYSEEYLELLDSAIERLAKLGIYTLLDLHWLDDENPFGPNRQFVPPLPDAESVVVWHKLARRYRANPAVMFDLLNEPHDVTLDQWRPWAEHLIDTVRGEAPDTLLFVSGTNWGYDLHGMPLDRPNIVYSTHVYRVRGAEWYEAFGHLAEVAPVFAAEFGGGEEDLVWGEQLIDFFEALEIGWAAWSYCDHPHLVRDGQVTPFGELVRKRLANPTMEA